MPRGKIEIAFECFFYWMTGGIILSFALAIILLPKPNFLIPIGFYLFVNLLLFSRYLYLDFKDDKKEEKNERGKSFMPIL